MAAQYRVDWFRIITDLTRKGHSLEAIGKEMGISKPAVWNIKQGGEPSYRNGKALLDMWHRECAPIPMQIDDTAIRAIRV